MEQKKITTYIDLLFCLVILPLVITLVPVDKWFVKYPLFATALVLYLYVLYFAIRRVNFPQLVMHRKYVQIILWVCLFIAIAHLLSRFPYGQDSVSALAPDLRMHLRKQIVWLLCLVVAGFGLSIGLILELFRQTLAKKEMETAKNKAELSLYKAQINPHFLFNTLNTLYGLVVIKSDKLEGAFIQFTNILQYMYRHATGDAIDIQEEINYIRHYIDLQRLRLNQHTQVVFENGVGDFKLQIPPMLLITFVENAFKYGASSSRDCTIDIRIGLDNNVLLFESENDIMNEAADNKNNTQIGLENSRKRLEILYPGRFSLESGEKDGRYKVRLMIQL